MANNAPRPPVPLVMTRTRAASETFVNGLGADVRAKVRPIYCPLIHVEPVHSTIEIAHDDGAIFTSANGVHHSPMGIGRTAYCVGPATTRAAHNNGWNALQAGTDADSLVAHLSELSPQQRLFHLSGRHTRGDVAARLHHMGVPVEHIVTYDQMLCPLTAQAKSIIAREKHVIVPLFSPRTAAQFAKEVSCPTSIHVIALSVTVAEALGHLQPASITIARSPNAQAMGSAINALL